MAVVDRRTRRVHLVTGGGLVHVLSGSPFREVAQPNRYEPQFLIRHADELGKSIGDRTSSHGIPADIAIVSFEMRGLMPATILGTCLLTMRRV